MTCCDHHAPEGGCLQGRICPLRKPMPIQFSGPEPTLAWVEDMIDAVRIIAIVGLVVTAITAPIWARWL